MTTTGDVLLAVGTRKGLFLGTSSDRQGWSWTGPHLPMQEVSAIGLDKRRGELRLLCGFHSAHWGPALQWSDDLGGSWQESKEAPLRFPDDAEASLEGVWQLQPGPASRPDEVWAGVEPAAVFRSEDRGESFELVRGLWDHPHRPTWSPGAGGQCLHTVLPHPDDPQRMTVGISTGGVYRTEDGGTTWAPSNTGIEARRAPELYPEYGQCVHKLARFPGDPDSLVLQNHGGVFRSTDDGRTWQAAAEGLPADFGFGLAVHPREAATAYLAPLTSDEHRLPPDGRLQVWRTDDGATTWHPSSDGLPEGGYWSLVLRDALTTDDADPVGVYLGTRVGEVWASLDEGGSWGVVASRLPDVLCVRATTLP